jgi:hypothetical protein
LSLGNKKKQIHCKKKEKIRTKFLKSPYFREWVTGGWSYGTSRRLEFWKKNLVKFGSSWNRPDGHFLIVATKSPWPITTTNPPRYCFREREGGGRCRKVLCSEIELRKRVEKFSGWKRAQD